MMNKIPFYRHAAAESQNWRCHYCELPMGGKGSPYAEAISSERKRLLVTAEHLHARQDGGQDSQNNIVAAHAICNQCRHRSKRSRSPTEFATYVKSRLAKKKWFSSGDLKLLAEARGTLSVDG